MSDMQPEGQGPIAGLGPGGSPHPEPEQDVAPAEPEWQGVSQEDWEQQQALLQQMQEQVQALGPLTEAVQQMPQIGQPQQQGLGPPPDPTYDPEGFSNWLDQRDSEREQRLAPMQEYYQQEQDRRGQEEVLDAIADMTSGPDKGFIHEESPKRAAAYARDFYPEMAAQFGEGDRAAEEALKKAIEYRREEERLIGQAYSEREQQRLQNLSNAPSSAGIAGPVAGQAVVTTPGTFQDVIRKYQNQLPSR